MARFNSNNLEIANPETFDITEIKYITEDIKIDMVHYKNDDYLHINYFYKNKTVNLPPLYGKEILVEVLKKLRLKDETKITVNTEFTPAYRRNLKLTKYYSEHLTFSILYERYMGERGTYNDEMFILPTTRKISNRKYLWNKYKDHQFVLGTTIKNILNDKKIDILEYTEEFMDD